MIVKQFQFPPSLHRHIITDDLSRTFDSPVQTGLVDGRVDSCAFLKQY